MGPTESERRPRGQAKGEELGAGAVPGWAGLDRRWVAGEYLDLVLEQHEATRVLSSFYKHQQVHSAQKGSNLSPLVHLPNAGAECSLNARNDISLLGASWEDDSPLNHSSSSAGSVAMKSHTTWS